MNLKEWRAAAGLSQKDAADRLGITRTALANYESGARPTPEAVMRVAGCDQTDPPPPRPPESTDPVVIAGKFAEEARALDPRNVPPAWMPKGTRRPTAQEIREFPHRYAGPDVWLTRHDPPKKYPNGAMVSITIMRGSGTGYGDYSMTLVGSTKGVTKGSGNGLTGIHRPFTPATGQPTPNARGPDPKGGKRKAA